MLSVAPRIPYHLDGSIFGAGSGPLPTLAAFNGYFGTGVTTNNYGGIINIVFAQPQDIHAAWISRTTPTTFYTSTDTTTGMDGTWTDQGYDGDPATPYSSIDDEYVNIRTFSSPITGVAGLSLGQFGIGNPGRLHACHLYGFRSAAASTDCLRIWDPVADTPLQTVIDYGDTPRTLSFNKTFRIKNTSTTLTASGVSVSQSLNGDATPTIVGSLSFSDDGSSFTVNSLSLSDMGPGDVTSVLTARFIPTDSFYIGRIAQGIRAAATSWA